MWLLIHLIQLEMNLCNSYYGLVIIQWVINLKMKVMFSLPYCLLEMLTICVSLHVFLNWSCLFAGDETVAILTENNDTPQITYSTYIGTIVQTNGLCLVILTMVCYVKHMFHWLGQDLDEWKCMMTSSNGNIFRVTGPLCGELTGPGEFPTQRPVTRSFDVFFDLRLNKQLSKQPWGWWFETPSWSLWRQRNGDAHFIACHLIMIKK